MENNTPFTIYNASAGSGKTFTLVKEYLKVVLGNKANDSFKNILAITFTNKAVGEMKERIIATLRDFASEDILINPTDMFKTLCDDLQVTPERLHTKSKNVLETILHNYASFDISTIDGFTHKIIRTFAHDLNLPLNFEVELDQDSLLTEAVDRLIAKAGTDKQLTKVLVEFAIEKADDDKSWDVTFDFNKIARLLVSENDRLYISLLSDKTFDDFKALKTNLRSSIKETEKAIIDTAEGVLALISECGLEHSDFSRGSVPNHFKKMSQGVIDLSFGLKWQEEIHDKPLYPKKVSSGTAQTIDGIQLEIGAAFEKTKALVFHIKFLKQFYKNITPLSVLNAINKELDDLKNEQNKILISEFNGIISHELKNQPTPFIYERLGEKFMHYFIDEFQDTSEMQWNNLIPLINNALSGQNLKGQAGTAMLVGDAKQSIYRWRGGKAEQFIDLCNNHNPFYIEKKVETLPANYRSFKEVVNFNNGFFTYLSENMFSDTSYGELYQKSAKQDLKIDNQGCVSLSFLDIERGDNRDEIYPEAVNSKIEQCLANGFTLKEICVLVRKKKEGVAIADFLSEKGLKITSSETLLMNNAPQVQFLVNLMKLFVQPDNHEITVEVLHFLSDYWNIEDKHNFFKTHVKLSADKLLNSFNNYGVSIQMPILLSLTLYDMAETLVREFKLVKNSNAYIQFFLDLILDYSQSHSPDLLSFLDYYEAKKDNLSIVSPINQDAVSIMTIHKSKGLEFPVVIFPYADLDIYREREPMAWFPLNTDEYEGFDYALLNYNNDFVQFGKSGEKIHSSHQAELELDNINLLYVALTRAVEQLHIISSLDINSKGETTMKKYSGLLINYLNDIGKWRDSQHDYCFGSFKKISIAKEKNEENHLQEDFISIPKHEHNINIVTKSGYLWDTAQEKAIEKGNLIHNIMAKIKTKTDVTNTMRLFIKDNIITTDQGQILENLTYQIVNHELLRPYYSTEYEIYNEREIITENGQILRPDRVVITPDKNAIILDYKTGEALPSHETQINSYGKAVESLGFTVAKKILVYTNDEITVKEV